MSGEIARLHVTIGADGKEFAKGLQDVQNKLQDVGKKMTDVGKNLTAKVTVPIVAVGTAAFIAANTMDKAMDTIRAGTGATGSALEVLGKDFRAVFVGVPQDAGQVSTAIADLNTRLGLSGQPLREMSTQMLNLSRVAGTEVGPLIASTTRVFGDWGIATKDQSKTLDTLWKVSQTTGIGVDQLAQKVVQFGAPLRAMGFSIDESTAMLGKWEKEGVNTELVLGSLRIAMGNFARDNIPMREGLDKTIKTIQELGPGAEATSLAMQVFGARAGPDMAAAILEGRFEIDELLATLQSSDETINAAAADTLSFAESMAILKNQATTALEPLGNVLIGLFQKFLPHIQKAIEFVSMLTEKFANLDPKWQAIILGAIGLAAILGPLLVMLGVMVTAIGALMSPITLIVLGIGALIAAGVALYMNWDTIKAKTIELWSGIKEAWNGIRATTEEVWNNIRTWLANLWQRIYTQAQQTWNNIKSFIFGVGAEITGVFNNLVTSAFNWGRNLITNFINGIKAMWDSLKETIGNVAGMIGDFLGFSSPTKLGPGRDADKWAPNLVEMFADGIKSAKVKLTASVGDMAASLNPAVSGVTHNTTHNTAHNSGGNTFNFYSLDEAEYILTKLGVRA